MTPEMDFRRNAKCECGHGAISHSCTVNRRTGRVTSIFRCAWMECGCTGYRAVAEPTGEAPNA